MPTSSEWIFLLYFQNHPENVSLSCRILLAQNSALIVLFVRLSQFLSCHSQCLRYNVLLNQWTYLLFQPPWPEIIPSSCICVNIVRIVVHLHCSPSLERSLSGGDLQLEKGSRWCRRQEWREGNACIGWVKGLSHSSPEQQHLAITSDHFRTGWLRAFGLGRIDFNTSICYYEAIWFGTSLSGFCFLAGHVVIRAMLVNSYKFPVAWLSHSKHSVNWYGMHRVLQACISKGKVSCDLYFLSNHLLHLSLGNQALLHAAQNTTTSTRSAWGSFHGDYNALLQTKGIWSSEFPLTGENSFLMCSKWVNCSSEKGRHLFMAPGGYKPACSSLSFKDVRCNPQETDVSVFQWAGSSLLTLQCLRTSWDSLSLAACPPLCPLICPATQPNWSPWASGLSINRRGLNSGSVIYLLCDYKQIL